MAKIKVLNRQDIFAVQDVETREIEVPEWGGAVYVRGLTGKERDAWEASMVKQSPTGKDAQINLVNARAKLVALCTVDEEGNRIFEDKDVANIGNKSAKAIDRIFAAAQELSGITEKDVKEITKNSEGILSAEE